MEPELLLILVIFCLDLLHQFRMMTLYFQWLREKQKNLTLQGLLKVREVKRKDRQKKISLSLSTIVLINVIQKFSETNKISAFKVTNYCFTSLKILNHPQPPQRNRLKIILERG